MAKIEDLISEVSDSRLRAEIAAEIKRLKTQKNFGLVFEQHLPETVRLPNFPVREGELVAETRRGRRQSVARREDPDQESDLSPARSS